MNCSTLKIGEQAVIYCGRGRRPKPCAYCAAPHKFLCDFPVGKTKSGKTKTCDVRLCLDCTQKGISKEFDFCRKHFPLAKAAYERRLAAGKTK